MRSIFAVTLALLLAAGNTAAADDYVERMSQEHSADKPVASPAAMVPPEGQIEEKEVEYASLEGRAIRGFFARPAGAAAAPGIIVIHEWWGLNDNIRAMARRLAGEGYQALAVDLYEGRVTEKRKEASAFMKEAMSSSRRLEENLQQAYAWLEKEGAAPRIGVIGWCFGGSWSLQTALLFPDSLDAAVIYYGKLLTAPEALRTLSMPILGIFGSRDKGIPLERVEKFRDTLKSLGKEADIVIYDGAEHAFANPSGTRYKEDAAADAWKRTGDFLSRHLKGTP
ncbi:dienelactone hydrolase family protein [Candidatus Moduliflexota bacterium]